mgnify:CR=1 FL=1
MFCDIKNEYSGSTPNMLRKSKEKSQIIFHPIDKKSKYCWWSFQRRSMRNRPISIANGILRLEISITGQSATNSRPYKNNIG